MRNFLALLVAIVFLGGTWYYMENIDGRGWQAVFSKAPSSQLEEEATASHSESIETTVASQPKPQAETIKLDDLTLYDTQNRALRCRIAMYHPDSIDAIRLPDGEEFTISLDSLSPASRTLVEGLRDQFKKENADMIQASLWDQAKEAIEVIVLVTENDPDTPEVKANLIQEDVLFRLYDVEKSSRGRDYNENLRINRGPVFLVGEKVVIGKDMKSLKSAIVKEFQNQQDQQSL